MSAYLQQLNRYPDHIPFWSEPNIIWLDNNYDSYSSSHMFTLPPSLAPHSPDVGKIYATFCKEYVPMNGGYIVRKLRTIPLPETHYP